MKYAFIGAVLIAVCSVGAVVASNDHGDSEAWSEESFQAFFGPRGAHRVTIESENGIVSVLEVPEGVILGVEGSERVVRDLRTEADAPSKFRGDLTIRTRRFDEVQEGENLDGGSLVSRSPLAITLHDVVVTVVLVE